MKLLLGLYRLFCMRVVSTYTRHELPGWGRVYDAFVGSYRRDWAWADAEPVEIVGKLHGYRMRLDLRRWSDRSAYFLRRFYDQETQAVMLAFLRPGETLIDVGANVGMITLLGARLVQPRRGVRFRKAVAGKVIAFEPNPEMAARLNETLQKNNIKNVDLRSIALGAQFGHAALHVPRVNPGEGSFGAGAYDADDMEMVDVKVETGDASLNGAPADFIKIDVEGFELEVLKGLAGTLEKFKPGLVIEVDQTHLARCGLTPRRLFEYLKSLGYELYAPCVRRGVHSLRLAPLSDIDMLQAPNGVFLHPESACRQRAKRLIVSAV
ncbi:MAG: FkbM family methyltransferase [Pseudomonadota bacterium]